MGMKWHKFQVVLLWLGLLGDAILGFLFLRRSQTMGLILLAYAVYQLVTVIRLQGMNWSGVTMLYIAEGIGLFGGIASLVQGEGFSGMIGSGILLLINISYYNKRREMFR